MQFRNTEQMKANLSGLAVRKTESSAAVRRARSERARLPPRVHLISQSSANLDRIGIRITPNRDCILRNERIVFFLLCTLLYTVYVYTLFALTARLAARPYGRKCVINTRVDCSRLPWTSAAPLESNKRTRCDSAGCTSLQCIKKFITTSSVPKECHQVVLPAIYVHFLTNLS